MHSRKVAGANWDGPDQKGRVLRNSARLGRGLERKVFKVQKSVSGTLTDVHRGRRDIRKSGAATKKKKQHKWRIRMIFLPKRSVFLRQLNSQIREKRGAGEVRIQKHRSRSSKNREKREMYLEVRRGRWKKIGGRARTARKPPKGNGKRCRRDHPGRRY